MDSFMWSKKLPARVQGKVYENLFHITDWFPTMLAISGITYTPEDGYELDGVNHLPSLLYGESTPRETMLYNFYYNVDYYAFDMWINGSFAVRNTQYKLMHTFNSSVYGVWYQPEDVLDDDDAITTETRCSASSNNDGGFTVGTRFPIHNIIYIFCSLSSFFFSLVSLSSSGCSILKMTPMKRQTFMTPTKMPTRRRKRICTPCYKNTPIILTR